MSRAAELVKAAAATAALLAVVVVVPIALGLGVGMPLPSAVPSWQQFSDALTNGDVADATLIKVVACVIWLAWLYVAAAVVNEAVAIARGVTSRPLPFSTPAVQMGAARVVAAAALLFGSLHARPASSLAPLPPVVAVAHVSPASTAADEVVAVEREPAGASAPAKEWTVAPRETLWGIAERTLGDGRAYDELFQLNRGRPQPDGSVLTDPGLIRPGMRLVLPERANVAPVASGTHRVAVGDTLSHIAARELGDPGRWSELFELNRGREQSDGRSLIDPDLLRPGWILRLPATAPAPTVAAPLPPAEAAVQARERPTAEAPSTPPDPVETAHEAAGRASDGEEADQGGPSLAEAVGWGGSAVLGGALLLAVRRLRRRRLHREGVAGLRRPTRVTRDLDLALRSASGSGEDLLWVARAMRELAASLRDRRAALPVPRLVEVGPVAIELLWTEALLPAVEGWATTDGGWSWSRERSSETSHSDHTAPCPTLVTIGARGDATVLANLESMGTLSITGPHAHDVARAMCLELGCTPFADVATIAICGSPEDGFSHLERVQPMTASDALVWARDRSGSVMTQLSGHDWPHTFAGRAAGTAAFEPIVVVTSGDALDEPAFAELRQLATPGSGVVLVVVGATVDGSEWVLDVDGDTAVLAPLGLSLRTTPVDAEAGSSVGLLLSDAAGAEGDVNEAVDPRTLRVSDVVDVAWTELVTGDAPVEEPVEDLGFRDPPCDVEVRMFGQVAVGGVERKLTPGELELLVYLLSHPGGQTADLIRTALWPDGRSLKTLHNRMSDLRSKLGIGGDGELLLPHEADERYHVSERIVSDWSRCLARIRHAETVPSAGAIEVLREALELVSGEPFIASTGYSWAYSEGLATEMVEIVKHAAYRLADLYLDASDPSGALWAVRRGQLVSSPADSQHLTRLAMEAHVKLGNVAAALDAYQELVADLEELDPGIEPDPQVTKVLRAITGEAHAS